MLAYKILSRYFNFEKGWLNKYNKWRIHKNIQCYYKKLVIYNVW